MPAWTALGVKSSTRVASSFGRGLVPLAPQPARATAAARRASRARRMSRAGYVARTAQCRPRRLRNIPRAHAPTGHVQSQPHAVAVANVPLLLQVLRLRDAQAASVRAGGS